MNPLGPQNPSPPRTTPDTWLEGIGHFLHAAIGTLDPMACFTPSDQPLTNAIFKSDTPTHIKTSMVTLLREVLGPEKWKSLIHTSQNESVENTQRQFSKELIHALRLHAWPITLNSLIIRDYAHTDKISFTLHMHRFHNTQFINCSFPIHSRMPDELTNCEFINCHLNQTDFSLSSGSITIQGGTMVGITLPESGLRMVFTEKLPQLCDYPALQRLFEAIPPEARNQYYISLLQKCDTQISNGQSLDAIIAQSRMLRSGLFEIWNRYYKHPLTEISKGLEIPMQQKNDLFLISLKNEAKDRTALLSGEGGQGGDSGDSVAKTVVDICHQALSKDPNCIFYTQIMRELYHNIPKDQQESALRTVLQVDEMLHHSNYLHNPTSTPGLSDAISYLKEIYKTDPKKMTLLETLQRFTT